MLGTESLTRKIPTEMGQTQKEVRPEMLDMPRTCVKEPSGKNCSCKWGPQKGKCT